MRGGPRRGSASSRSSTRVSEATRRARGQWLHAPGGDVLQHLLALQAQDVRTPALVMQVRGGELDDGMRITWLMRSTLHLVHAHDLVWLHPLFAPRLEAGNRRRLKQLAVTEAQAERAVELIASAVPATRAVLKALLASHGIPVDGQAIVHLLARAAMQGRVAQTPERVFVALELPPPPDRDRSLEELARRYYAAHAGATADDLAYWSGLPKRDCRPPQDDAGEDGPVPRVLLGAFDELLLGWRDRTPTVPAEHAKAVHPGGGILRPVVLEDGVAVGTWTVSGGESLFTCGRGPSSSARA
jgi:DNA glycosylase AlkZ-like